jgi:hypothetical protein
MKRTFTLLVCLLGMSAIHAQQPSAMLQETRQMDGSRDSVITWYTYTADEQVETSITQRLDEVGNWQNLLKMDFTYDNAGNKLEEIQADWYAPDNAWRNLSRITNTYTADNQLETALTEMWTGTWDLDYKTVSYFNGVTGLKDSTIHLDWLNMAWQPIGKEAFSYNADEMLVQAVIFQRNANSWVPNDRYTYTYTDFGEIAGMLNEIYYTINTWVGVRRETYTYNTDEQLVVVVTEGYDAQNTNWYQTSRSELEYNSDGTRNFVVMYLFDEALGQFVPMVRITYFYDEFLGLEESEFAALEVYPNPTQDFVQIRFAQPTTTDLTLTDLQGKTIATQSGVAQLQIFSLQALPAGTYLLTIRSGVQVQTKQLVKM